MTAVFIFGAGFSTGYNPEIVPLISNFLKIAKNNNFLKPDDEHKELVKFIKKYFGEDYQDVNIETLATFLTTDLVPDVQQKNEFREKLNRQLNLIIIRTLSNLYYNPQDNPTKEIYQNFVNKLVEKGNDVITFNYDLILDNLLLNTNNWFPQDGYSVNMNLAGFDQNINIIDTKDTNKYSKIKYLKLHGSLNWGRSILQHPYRGNEILLSPFGTCPDQPISPIERMVSSGIYNKNVYYETFFIPPILNKDDLSTIPLLQNVWYNAKSIISMAEEIFIIGYSLPSSDFMAEFLFRQALAFFPKSFIKINIINININDQYINRIKTIFQKGEINPIKQDVVSFLKSYVKN